MIQKENDPYTINDDGVTCTCDPRKDTEAGHGAAVAQ